MNEEELKKLSEHFFEKCPTEARNFFHRILEKLEDIDKKIEALELKINKTF